MVSYLLRDCIFFPFSIATSKYTYSGIIEASGIVLRGADIYEEAENTELEEQGDRPGAEMNICQESGGL